jgi:hypothetical protein
LKSTEVVAPQRVVVVLDGSESMREVRKEVDAALRAIPVAIPSRVIVATRHGIAEWSPVLPWAGGVDALRALKEALRPEPDLARKTVVWVAGEQPLKNAGTERIRQTLEREIGFTDLLILANGGENAVVRGLDGAPGVQLIPRFGTTGQDLQRVFEHWTTGTRERVAMRRAVPSGSLSSDVARGSDQIARLWAAEETPAIALRDPAEAARFASAHRIVTPFSGAVVLETDTQYRQNGLETPSSPATITPEPATWILFGAGLGVLALSRWRRRRSG